MQNLTIEHDSSAGIMLALALCSEHHSLCMALNFELAQEGGAPEWAQLLPPGQIITGRDGRTWINDRPEQLVAAFAAEGKDLPIDWEHSTQLKAPKGEESPAAGWIKVIELREDGTVWARVAWTEKGAATIANREYRYLSPVFHFEIETNRIFRIVSAGLTNNPNLHLEALNHEQETDMLKKLLVALGLPETTTEDAALNHVITMRNDYQTALNQAQHPPLDKFVPRADYQTAINRAEAAETNLKKITDDALETAINTEIAAALKAGKITPSTKEYHVAQCRQEGGLKRFQEFVAAAPVIAGATDLDNKEPGRSDTALNAEEQRIAGMFGNSPEDIKKYGSA